MKKIINVLIFLILLNQLVYAQTGVLFSYNSIHTGRNIIIAYKKNINNSSYLLGLKYNINRIITDNQNNIFKKRFYATSFIEHFGFNLGYQFNFKIQETPLKPFLFYDLQFTYSHTRNDMLLFFDYDSINGILYHKRLEYFGPTIAIEHNIGVGISVKLYKNLFLYQKVGGGIVQYYKIDKRLFGDNNWELGEILSIGLIFNI